MELRELHAWYRAALLSRIEALEQARDTSVREERTSDLTRLLAEQIHESAATYGYPRVALAAAALQSAPPGDIGSRVEELLQALRSAATGGEEPEPIP